MVSARRPLSSPGNSMTSRNLFLAAIMSLTCLQCGPAPNDDGVPFASESNGGVDLTAGGPVNARLVEIGGVVASGSGCPSDTVSAIVQQQGGAHALTFLFSALTARGRSPFFGMARGDLKTCQIAVELTPAPGYRIMLANIQTRGSVDVFGPRDTRAGVNNAVRIQREFVFDAGNGSGFRFPLLETYLVSSSGAYTIEEHTRGFSYGRCNATATARAWLTLQVTGDDNQGEISSIDENAAPAINLLMRPCTDTEPTANAGIVDVATDEQRELIKNACALRGVGTPRRMEVCYGENGEVLSSRPDPNL